MEEFTRVGTFSNEKLNSNGIRTIKDQTLLAPGFWNGRNYTKEEIIKCFRNTNWSDPDVVSLIADHRDDDSKGRPLTIRDWLGFTSNHSLTDDGFIKADLNICDSELATKLIDGKAPFGISPFVHGMFDESTQSQVNFVFKNSAVVVEPACKESYINQYLSDDELNQDLNELSAEERIKKRTGLPLAEIQKLAETTSNDISGSEVNSKGLQPIDYKKKKKKGPGGHTPDGTGPHGAGAGPGKGKADGSGMKNESNLKQLKGGKKMAENEEEKTEENTEEVAEEKTEEVKEETTEAPVEETAPEAKAEEVVEEESEEKLLDKMADIANKLANKRKITPEQAKMQAMEKEISSLKDRMQKLEEMKVSQPNKANEKLSAKSMTRAGTKLEEDNGFSFGASNPMQGSRELAAMMNLI